jgi:hypothetical protein
MLLDESSASKGTQTPIATQLPALHSSPSQQLARGGSPQVFPRWAQIGAPHFPPLQLPVQQFDPELQKFPSAVQLTQRFPSQLLEQHSVNDPHEEPAGLQALPPVPPPPGLPPIPPVPSASTPEENRSTSRITVQPARSSSRASR